MKNVIAALVVLVLMTVSVLACPEDEGCGRCSIQKAMKMLKQAQRYLPEPNPCTSNCDINGTVTLSSGGLMWGVSNPPKIYKSDDLKAEADKIKGQQNDIDEVAAFIADYDDRIK